jgi:hypothetical protein
MFQQAQLDLVFGGQGIGIGELPEIIGKKRIPRNSPGVLPRPFFLSLQNKTSCDYYLFIH